MIYLDHAAATPVAEMVLEAMKPYFTAEFFNPSAAYLPAKKVATEYEAAKGEIAHAIGAKAANLVMTAGATEANNLAFTCISGRVLAASPPPKFCKANILGVPPQPSPVHDEPTRILYLATEHDSVRLPAKRLGGQEIAVDRNGRILLDDLKAKISDETMLVSVALANNELGTLQPLAEVAAVLREVRLDRLRRGVRTPIYLHSDASQALNLLDVNVARLGVDLMTLNAAKVYGPKGVGALYVANGVKLAALNYGGGQENGLRAGTENVPGVVGFATALNLAKKHLAGNRKKYAEWRKILVENLQGCEVVNKKYSLDNFIVLCYNGIDAERLIYLLEERGVYVATGAACAASKGIRSRALAAIGLTDTEIAGSLRLTFGETNTEEQIREAAQILNEVTAAERRRIAHE